MTSQHDISTSASAERYRALDISALNEVDSVLGADITRCMDEAQAIMQREGHRDQFWARTLVRTFFSWVEASTFEMKEIVLAADRVGVAVLSEAERGALTDVSYELDDRARPRRRVRFLPLEQLVRFVHRLFARIYCIDDDVPVRELGWEQFREALRVRNRITHPKGPQTIELSPDEMLTTAEAIHGTFASTANSWHAWLSMYERVSSRGECKSKPVIRTSNEAWRRLTSRCSCRRAIRRARG